MKITNDTLIEWAILAGVAILASALCFFLFPPQIGALAFGIYPVAGFLGWRHMRRDMRQRTAETRAAVSLYTDAEQLGLQNGRSRRPVHFVVDETAAFGKFDLITAALRAWRSSGIRLHMFFQNLSQIQQAFEKGAGAITDAEVIQFLGSQDHETLEFMSKLYGERDMIVPTEGSNAGMSVSDARGTTQGSSRTETLGEGTSSSESRTGTRGKSWSETHGTSETEGTSETSGTSSSSNWGSGGNNSSSSSSSHSSSWSSSVSWSHSLTEGGSSSKARGVTSGRSSNQSRADGVSSSTSATQTQGTSEGRSHSVTLQLRRSFRPDELRRMPDDRMIVIVTGAEPAFLFKEQFYLNPPMVARAAISFSPSGNPR